MDRNMKAQIILKALDDVLSINWNFQKEYLEAIINGLKQIEKFENIAK